MVTVTSPEGAVHSEEKKRTALWPEAARPPMSSGLMAKRPSTISVIAVRVSLVKADYPVPAHDLRLEGLGLEVKRDHFQCFIAG